MRKPSIISLSGWVIALAAACLSFILLSELQETRIRHRLEQVRLPARATLLPENWDVGRYRVLLVGDSRIRLWTPLPAVSDTVFATSAIGGETTGQLMDRFQADVLAVDPRPDEIILAAGINDLVAASVQTRNAEALQERISRLVLERLGQMADMARAQGIKVRIATIVQPADPDVMRRLLFWDDVLFDMVSAANDKIAELGHETIDFNGFLDGGDGPLPKRFSVDTLHFNAAAYETLNDAIGRLLQPR